MNMYNLLKRNVAHIFKRQYSKNRSLILGIETSCDDTGCAIVDNEGNILGEALNSQHLIHLRHGGIIPPIAQNLHRENIEGVVHEALKSANITCNDVDAIATTVKPGLPLSLTIGMKYGTHLCRTFNKPFIPIHHMEAHALTARMHDPSIEFPFLVLLISGGHCLLAVVKDVDKFLLMGQSHDDAPGEVFDKMARRLQLKNISEYSDLSGGQAVELAASRATDPLEFNFTPTLLKYRDCNFSFAGNKNQCLHHIVKQEKEFDLLPDAVIPGVSNLCAGLLLVVTRHLCHRVQRGIEYVRLKKLIPYKQQTLVVSGGVACNNFIAKGLEIVCEELGYRMIRPPPKLCTDNGVMIAWNGMERWNTKKGVTDAFDSIEIQKCSPLGESIIEDVTAANIAPRWIKLTKLIRSHESQYKSLIN